jgi:xanthine dehydrogenase accessory factor
MESVDIEVLRTCLTWRDAGHAAVLCTVVKTWGSAPRPVGSMAAIRADGRIVGSVSGGCVEDDLVARMLEHALAANGPELVTYGVSKEQAERFRLPCGGTIELVLEPLAASGWIEQVMQAVAQRQLVRRILDIGSGACLIVPGKLDDEFSFDGQRLATVHGPRWRLLLIGAGQLSGYLAQMAKALDYEVTVCDPRDDYAAEWPADGATLSRAMPDDLIVQMGMDPHCAVVALTHDPKLDDMALLEALKSPAFYVGSIGSAHTTAKRRERLALFDLEETHIARLHGPVGLAIGSLTPPEIAVSILAEMTAVRRGAQQLNFASARAAHGTTIGRYG